LLALSNLYFGEVRKFVLNGSCLTIHHNVDEA